MPAWPGGAGPHSGVDYRVFHWVNRFQVRTAWLHAPLRAYAQLGIAAFAALLLAGWWVARSRTGDRFAAWLWACVAPLVVLAVNQLVGHVVRRSRPYAHHAGVHLLVARTGDFSFPSDHAVVAGAVAAGLFFVDRRIGLVAAVAAVLMAFARVYVGAHYPGDVAAGLIIGSAVTAAGVPLAVWALAPFVERLRTTRLRPLVSTA